MGLGISSAGSTWRKRGHAIQLGYQLGTDLGSCGSNMSKVCPQTRVETETKHKPGGASSEHRARGSQSQNASGGRICTRGYVEWALLEWTMVVKTGESLHWGTEGYERYQGAGNSW